MNGSDLANLETLKNNLENYHLAHSDEIILKGSIDNIINYCDNSISKDKIRAKIKELEEKSDYWNCDEIEVLKGLLEEN
jgi:hypothetical protein